MTVNAITKNQKAIALISGMKIGRGRLPEPNSSIGFEKDGKLVGAVVFNNFTGRDIWVSVWSDDKSIWTRKNMKIMCDYPFNICRVKRISTVVRRGNKKAIKLNKQFGFVEEGVSRRLFGDDEDGDGVFFGLLKEDCRWL